MTFPTKWRSLEDLADFLEKQFPPECIREGEPEVDAHRRAGAVGLAQRIIATVRREGHEVDPF